MLLTNQTVLIRGLPPLALSPTTLNPILNTSTSSSFRQDNMTCYVFCLLRVCLLFVMLAEIWLASPVSHLRASMLLRWCFLPVLSRLNDKLERRQRNRAPYQTSCMMEMGSTLVRTGFWTWTKCKPRLTLHLPFKLVKDDTLSANHVFFASLLEKFKDRNIPFRSHGSPTGWSITSLQPVGCYCDCRAVLLAPAHQRLANSSSTRFRDRSS